MGLDGDGIGGVSSELLGLSGPAVAPLVSGVGGVKRSFSRFKLQARGFIV